MSQEEPATPDNAAPPEHTKKAAGPRLRTTEELLDAALIRSRRRTLGLSERVVAKALGVSAHSIAVLERGQAHGELSLPQVLALGEVLGLSLSEMLVKRPEQPEGAKLTPAGLAGLLHLSGTLTSIDALAEASGVTPAEVKGAAGALDEGLRPLGLRVHQVGTNLSLAPAAGDLDEKRLAELMRLHHDRKTISLSMAQVLHEIQSGKTKGIENSNPKRVALGALMNAGHVRRDVIALSDSCRHSLYLETESPPPALVIERALAATPELVEDQS